MTFQAVLGQRTIKTFTKCLTCLSRYGDDVIMIAGADALCLISTNSSKSAFCRITLKSQYFEKYRFRVASPPGLSFQTPAEPDSQNITSQLLVKSLLSILKHKTVEKSVDRCELSIVERDQDKDRSVNSEEDSLESVTKTHRLLLLESLGPLTPIMNSSPSESCVTVGPRALKDILEHFPHAKGPKSDPQLIWLFSMNDVKIKSQEGSADVKSGKSQILTEISISADEFDSYNISVPPVSLAFHLREFNATISLAESFSVALDMRFTESAEPIYITFDTNDSESEYLFIISTTQTVYDPPLPSKSSGAANLRKRDREDNQEHPGNSQAMITRPAKKKSLSVAAEQTPSITNKRREPSLPQQHVPPANMAHAQNNESSGDVTISDAPARKSHSTPLFMPGASQVSQVDSSLHMEAKNFGPNPEPLFMPGASQLSQADMDILRLSGLGIEHMDYDEFEAMMDAEGEEVGMSTGIGDVLGHRQGTGEQAGLDMEDDMQLPSTQVPIERKRNKEFRPLFDD